MLLAELHECGFYAYGKWLSRVTFEPKMLDLGATRLSKEAIHSNTRLEREVRNVIDDICWFRRSRTMKIFVVKMHTVQRAFLIVYFSHVNFCHNKQTRDKHCKQILFL